MTHLIIEDSEETMEARARAICQSLRRNPDDEFAVQEMDGSYSEFPQPVWTLYRAAAVATLEADRERAVGEDVVEALKEVIRVQELAKGGGVDTEVHEAAFEKARAALAALKGKG